MSDKHDLCLRLRNYILHGLLIHRRSRHAAYRCMGRAVALDRLRPLSEPDLFRYYTTTQLCRLVIARRYDLEKILPVPTNASYRSSLLKLEQLLEFAHSLLNHPHDTSFLSPPVLCPNTLSSGSPPLE